MTIAEPSMFCGGGAMGTWRPVAWVAPMLIPAYNVDFLERSDER